MLFKIWAFVFGRPIFRIFNYLMFQLSLRGMGIYNYSSHYLSGENWLIKKKIKKIGNQLVIFDVGANNGDFTKLIIESGVSIAAIYAFEPHPNTFVRLEKNLASNNFVRPIQLALSSHKGNDFLYDRLDFKGLGSAHASLSDSIFSQVYKTERTKVMIKKETLDNFCEENSISNIDFLKIDTEGNEFEVLKGSSKMLNNRKIKVIQFEFTQLNSTIGIFFKQFYDLLSEHYDLYRLLPNGIVKIKNYDATVCEIFAYQNFVAILKEDKVDKND